MRTPNGPKVSASEAEDGSPPAKLDPDKFGDEAARPNRWLDRTMHSLKVPSPSVYATAYYTFLQK